MSAFLVIAAHVHDRERFMSGYGPAAAALIKRFGGSYVVRRPAAELLEGKHFDGASVVVSEWPDRDAALRFWNSPEYAQVRKLREGIADVNVLLVG